MKAFSDFTVYVSADREVRQNHQTLISCVVPRPIAFVSTVSEEGVRNLAPFSFFNAVSSNPPTVLFAPGTKRDGTGKDTLNNVRAVGEFVVNVVPHAISAAMNQASFAYPPEVDEFESAGFTPLPSRFVRPCRVGESPVHLECKLVQIVPIGHNPPASHLCIGEVVCFHIADGFAQNDGRADAATLDLVGRMGGDDYATTRDRFTLPKPTARS